MKLVSSYSFLNSAQAKSNFSNDLKEVIKQKSNSIFNEPITNLCENPDRVPEN